MLDFQTLLAQRVRRFDASGIRKVFDLAATLKDPINLSIGIPHLPVPMPIKQAMIQAIENDQTAYSQSQGLGTLRQRIEQHVNRQFQRDGRWESYGTIVTSGVSGGLLLALLATIETEDQVIIPDPYFVMYKHQVTMAGGTPIPVDTYPDFQLTAERVEPMITDRTKVLIIASPSNPTGVVTGEENFRQLVELCRRHNILLICDEIYDELCYEKIDAPAGPIAPSPALITDQMLLLRGFSKTYAMTGLRMGYACGPVPLIEQMIKLQQYTFVCAPTPAQVAGVVALDTDVSQTIDQYRSNRDYAVQTISKHFELTAPGGAIFLFPKAPANMTGMTLVEKAVQENLLIVPGNVFSERNSHFRISYATDPDTLACGLEILCRIARTA